MTEVKRWVWMRSLAFFVISVAFFGCTALAFAERDAHNGDPQMSQQVEHATFAGGCFWCMQPPFEQLDGVLSVAAGYTGGAEKTPTYAQVSSGSTGHCEAVQIVYDPSTVTYQRLLDVFWRNIDPTTPNRQFADVGTQYRTAIFYHTEEQRQLAQASKQQLAQSGTFDQPIVTEIVPASAFYPAEEYHQDFYKKNPLRYKLYRIGSGRDRYLHKLWGRQAH